jgi:hypothetical protein
MSFLYYLESKNQLVEVIESLDNEVKIQFYNIDRNRHTYSKHGDQVYADVCSFHDLSIAGEKLKFYGQAA